MIDNSKEYVLCAAIWYKHKFRTPNPRGYVAQNISEGMVIGQWRHGNCIWAHKQSKLGRCIGPYKQVQGFITSHGRFVDRWQGMELAYLAGQVSEEDAIDKNFTEERIPTEEFQKQEPHNRHITKDYNGYHMMYSEHLY